MKTLRTHYYTPSKRFFAMDNEVNVLITNLTEKQLGQKVSKGMEEKNYSFIVVVQSWIRYPRNWILNSFNISRLYKYLMKIKCPLCIIRFDNIDVIIFKYDIIRGSFNNAVNLVMCPFLSKESLISSNE